MSRYSVRCRAVDWSRYDRYDEWLRPELFTRTLSNLHIYISHRKVPSMESGRGL